MKTLPYDDARCTGKNESQECKVKERCLRYTSPWGDYQPVMEMQKGECKEMITEEDYQ